MGRVTIDLGPKEFAEGLTFNSLLFPGLNLSED
jgi:hypothetical protein